MKKLILFISISLFATSCHLPDDILTMNEILSKCEGHAIVVAKGYNEGNYETHRYYLIIRDDTGHSFEYRGANYNVSVGDTLK